MRAALLWLALGVVALIASSNGFDARLVAVGLFGLAGLSSLKGTQDGIEPQAPPRAQADPQGLTTRPAK